MPVVAGMGGNAATQTLAVIVRGIALGELTWSNSPQGAVQGRRWSASATASPAAWSARGVVWLMQGNPWLGLILAMAMIINMFVAAIAGTLIPLALRAMKVDPALASSVFITTLTDVFGFFSFLGLAPVHQVLARSWIGIRVRQC